MKHAIIKIKIGEDVKDRMNMHPEINWNAFAEKVISKTLREKEIERVNHRKSNI